MVTGKLPVRIPDEPGGDRLVPRPLGANLAPVRMVEIEKAVLAWHRGADSVSVVAREEDVGCDRIIGRIDGHTMPSKAKVSVSVDRSLLREADRLAGRMTRSQIFENALAAWVRRRGQADLDQAIERYYASLSTAERREDDDWASLGDEMLRRGWDE